MQINQVPLSAATSDHFWERYLCLFFTHLIYYIYIYNDTSGTLYAPPLVHCHHYQFIIITTIIVIFNFWSGYDELRKIYRKKETHTWAVQIVKQILDHASSYEYEDDGSNPHEGSPTSLESTFASQFEFPSTNNAKSN